MAIRFFSAFQRRTVTLISMQYKNIFIFNDVEKMFKNLHINEKNIRVVETKTTLSHKNDTER
jgi:hypothetical protein